MFLRLLFLSLGQWAWPALNDRAITQSQLSNRVSNNTIILSLLPCRDSFNHYHYHVFCVVVLTELYVGHTHTHTHTHTDTQTHRHLPAVLQL